MCHSIECGHGYPHRHAPDRASHHHWGCCCGSGYGMRRFRTKKEILAELEEYLEQLQAESKGVEEHIAEIKKA